jgi:hypothetical protein
MMLSEWLCWSPFYSFKIFERNKYHPLPIELGVSNDILLGNRDTNTFDDSIWWRQDVFVVYPTLNIALLDVVLAQLSWALMGTFLTTLCLSENYSTRGKYVTNKTKTLLLQNISATWPLSSVKMTNYSKSSVWYWYRVKVSNPICQ